VRFNLVSDTVRDNCINTIRGLNLGEKWQVIIEPYKKNRTNNQNRLYWSWINILSNHFGLSSDDMHDTLAARLLGYRTIEFQGKAMLIRKSTAKLTTAEFTAYMDTVAALALYEGMTLPHGFVEDLNGEYNIGA
jgi:hypothetical protein